MSLLGRFNRFFVVVFCVVCAPAFAARQKPIEPTAQIVTVKIKLDERSMIIVPVSVNGAGPYDFVLDTGCSKTIVDRKLAGELSLPPAGETTIVGVLASAKLSVVHVNSLSVGGATVQEGEVFSAKYAANVASRVRGVLGEDFLLNFDVLIDYRHLVMRLEPAPGSLAETAVGEHLPMQRTASDHGELARTRPVIYGRIPELGDASMSLLLDSGANQLTLFRDNLGPGAVQAEPLSAGSFSRWVTSAAAARRIRSLDLGRTTVSNLIAIGLASRTGVAWDGVLPTSLFQSVLISHFGRFVILNPSFPKASDDALATR
jgi:predicted aspartyl protease